MSAPRLAMLLVAASVSLALGAANAPQDKRTQGTIGEIQAGKACPIRPFEVELPDGKKVQRRDTRIDSLRPRQGMGNRRAHVGIAKLGEHRTIGIVNQRMDHALRMDHHLDAVRRCVEQPMGLDHFQPLVHHRRRID